MFRQIPDWLFYAVVLSAIYIGALLVNKNVVAPPPPADLGPLLPSESPRDEQVITQVDIPRSGTGTAFAIDEQGGWLTARHVVDGCHEIALKTGRNRIIPATAEIYEQNDLAKLQTQWTRPALPHDVHTPRRVGETGYFIGFPQGRPGEAIGNLLSRSRMLVRGRYTSDESVLAWAEIGRTVGLNGSLGGLSGAPVLDGDGEIIGVVTAENPRRGRIYTVAPRALWPFFTEKSSRKGNPLEKDRYGLQADQLRRERRIAQVLCLVEQR